MKHCQVIGFEGSLDDMSDVTWGTAALCIGNTVTNPVTSRSMPLELLDTESLHQIPEPIPVSWEDGALVVVAINESSPFKSLLLNATKPEWLVTAPSSQEGFTYLVVQDLRRYNEEVARAVLQTQDLAAVRMALCLDPHHPRLNAMRAHLVRDKDPERVRQLSRACTRGEEEGKEFDSYLAKLEAERSV